MKLIIQIPCYNEEGSLPVVIRALPRKIEGVDKIEILVINDGSADNTSNVAKGLGVEHILELPYHRGLAETFRAGLEESLRLGADIIVNTDGDNQYQAEDISKLVEPILKKRAEIVIGCRDIFTIKHFSITKKILQNFGSYIVRKFSNTSIPDTTSGFRAYSRDAALRMNVFSRYTYTLETIIQAGRKEIPIACVSVRTNEKIRESRLIKSIPSYIKRSIATILRIYLMYEPMSFFVRLGSLFLLGASMLGVRYLYFFAFGSKHGGHIQSLILAIIFSVLGIQLIFIGFLADIIAANRKLSEEILYRQRKEHLKPVK
ncbi:MAG: glycosyltransferase family 2 protein [Candidatus Omnitrophica bacterium]|nr:glycosyltransferase family 2 protein [Candidatus Omnitrophota bacterium]